MKKIIIQGLIGFFSFVSLWVILAQIDWLPLIKIEAVNKKTEEKLGKILWDAIKQSETINKNESVTIALDSLITRICKKNKINRNKIKLHIVNSEEVNAFALPDGHLVVYSALIKEAENPEELCGILSHELAHIELNHVMKKLVTEIGLSTLISMTTGGGGSEVTKETIKLLTSSAFDRKLEKEADLKAVEYLYHSNISCEPFANFLFRLSENENNTEPYFNWISTHPDSKTRAEYIIQLNKNQKITSEAVIDSISWVNLKKDLSP